MNLAWTPHLCSGPSVPPPTPSEHSETTHTLGLYSDRRGGRVPSYAHSCLPVCSSLSQPQEWKSRFISSNSQPYKQGILSEGPLSPQHSTAHPVAPWYIVKHGGLLWRCSTKASFYVPRTSFHTSLCYFTCGASPIDSRPLYSPSASSFSTKANIFG